MPPNLPDLALVWGHEFSVDRHEPEFPIDRVHHLAHACFHPDRRLRGLELLEPKRPDDEVTAGKVFLHEAEICAADTPVPIEVVPVTDVVKNDELLGFACYETVPSSVIETMSLDPDKSKWPRIHGTLSVGERTGVRLQVPERPRRTIAHHRSCLAEIHGLARKVGLVVHTMAEPLLR